MFYQGVKFEDNLIKSFLHAYLFEIFTAKSILGTELVLHDRASVRQLIQTLKKTDHWPRKIELEVLGKSITYL